MEIQSKVNAVEDIQASWTNAGEKCQLKPRTDKRKKERDKRDLENSERCTCMNVFICSNDDENGQLCHRVSAIKH